MSSTQIRRSHGSASERFSRAGKVSFVESIDLRRDFALTGVG